MTKIIRIGMDTSKSVFVLHGVDAAERPVLRKKLRRRQVLDFLPSWSPRRSAGGVRGSALLARELRALGHEVVLLPRNMSNRMLKRNKNDAADAEAICEAMSRPTMRFVPVKSAEQQSRADAGGRARAAGRPPHQISNAIRGYAASSG